MKAMTQTFSIIRHRVFLLLLLMCISPNSVVAQNEIITLSVSVEEPYSGPNLENNGYVGEIVSKAFAKSGYDADIKFYPLARARSMAARGNVNGFAPAYKDPSDEQFIYSDPFPGDNIGLLKRKDFDAVYSLDSTKEISSTLEHLKNYRFGLLNGFSLHAGFDSSPEFKKEYVSDQLVNIDKLAKGRIDFVVIDKYTAADLITRQRPHLIGELEFMFPALVKRPFHIAFSKKAATHENDLQAFNKGLRELKDSGELVEIQKSHALFSNTEKQSNTTRLVIGTVNNKEMAVMQELSEQYNKLNPNIDIEWRVTGEENLRKRLLSDLAINDGQYDIMTIGSYETQIWAKRKWLHPIVPDPEHYDLADVIPPVREALSLDHQLYALPFYAESSMTYYNKALFTKSGLTMPKSPTYTEISEFAAKIHDPDNGVYGVCLRGKGGWGSNMALIGTMVNTYGGRWFDENWEPQLQTSAWRAALKTYINLLKNYAHPDTVQYNFNENKSLFANGKCGMWIDATVAAGMVFDPKQSKVHEHVGFAFAPTAKTPKGSHWLWVWSLGIPSSSKNKQAALNFIEWATSKSYIQEVAENKGWVSVPPGTRLSTYRSDDYKKAAPFSDFVLQAIQKADTNSSTLDPVPYTGIQFVEIPEFSAFGDYVGMEIEKILYGKNTIDQALENSNNFIKRQMKSSGYIK